MALQRVGIALLRRVVAAVPFVATLAFPMKCSTFGLLVSHFSTVVAFACKLVVAILLVRA